MQFFLLLLLALAIGAAARQKVVHLHANVGDENISCDFKIVFRRMKVKVGSSHLNCSEPSNITKFENYVLKNKKVKVIVNFVVSKSGNGKITRAKIEKNSGRVFRLALKNMIMPNFSSIRPPKDWKPVNVTEMRNMESGRKRWNYWGGYKCDTNAFDHGQWCLCRPNQKVARIQSYHSNHYEDRRWTFTCKDIEGFTSGQTEISPYSHWDGTVVWHGLDDWSFLVGMQSYHNDDREDRRFRFFSRRNDNWEYEYTLDDHTWEYVNNHDHPMDINLEPDEVIVALVSWHNNHYEDREWLAMRAKLKYKCAGPAQLTTDVDNAKKTVESEEWAYLGEIDASLSTTPVTEVVKFSKSKLNSMSSKTAYSRTSGFEFSVGMKLTKKIGMQVEIVNIGGEIEFEVKAKTTHSETHKIEETEGFQEGKQGSSQWTVTCLPGYICKTFASIHKVTIQAPYTLRAGSCTEIGVSTLETGFSGKIKKEDTYGAPGSPPNCKDDDRFATSCPTWAKFYCSGRYEQWMRKYCPKSCQFCK